MKNIRSKILRKFILKIETLILKNLSGKLLRACFGIKSNVLEYVQHLR